MKSSKPIFITGCDSKHEWMLPFLEKRFENFMNYENLKAYRDFGGIRNEENFVITNEGYRLLGKNKPKTIEDVIKQKSI